MQTLPRITVLVVVAAGASCVPELGGGGEPRYRVQQSARFLPPVPGVRSGAPMAATTEVAVSTGAVTVADPNDEDSGNPVDQDIPFAFGAGVRRTFGDGHGFDVGVGLDLLLHSVPAAQQSRCAEAYCLLATLAQPLGDPGADYGPFVSIGLAARVGAATGGSP